MRSRYCLLGAMAAALVMGASVQAATITHTSLDDFAAGRADGSVVALAEPAGTGSGAFGVLPGIGASVLADEFNYTTQAQAEAAGWIFTTPNASDAPDLSTYPNSIAIPTAGKLRMHVSRPSDFWNTGVVGQRSPFLALKDQAVTGDFVVEARIDQEPRLPGENRHAGIFIGQYVPGSGVYFDNNSAYLIVGPSQDTGMTSATRFHSDFDPWPHGVDSQALAGGTAIIRVVKRGEYFYSYMKAAESDPWIYQARFQIPPLVGTDAAPLVVGLFAKSWGGTGGNSTRYRDIDVDYFHVNRIGTLSGTFSDVLDAGSPVNWQALSIATPAASAVKYQMRTGNAVSDGHVTDGGPLAGPDGTVSTWFEDDVAAAVPDPAGKRYLEYSFSVDATDPNLPPMVREVSATYQPGGLDARLASSTAQFGPDAGGTQVQTGDGDLSLARAEVFRDDFNGTLASGWDEPYLGNPFSPGEMTLTERSGFLRMKLANDQNFWVGTEKTGGLKLLRNLPAGLTDYEVETEVDMETQVSRIGQIVLWQDESNWIAIGAMQRFWDFPVGAVVEPILGDAERVTTVEAYGTNAIKLRIAKHGQVITLSYRDAASPAWHVARTFNAAGLATGGTDFTPTKAGLMSRSYGLTDRVVVNHDFNYFTVSSLTPAGTRDINLTLPEGQRLDEVALYGDGLTAANARFQLRNTAGTFVGPDGTASTFFTVNEPRIPADLNTGASQTLRVQVDASSGVPYLHAVGVQFATGTTCVARDANGTDFAAGLVKNGIDAATTPGVITPTISLGTTETDEFDYTSNEAAVDNGPWMWVNPSGQSSYSFTTTPGSFRMEVMRPEDLWTTPELKNFVFLGRDAPVTGDWEIETVIRHPAGRQDLREDGLGVFAAAPAGGLDVNSFLLFGPILLDSVEFTSIANNVAATGLHGGYNGYVHYLRMRKTGDIFTTWVRTDPSADWTLIDTRTNTYLRTAYIGLLAKAWGASGQKLAAEYDFFKFSPVLSTGTFESRVLEMGDSCPVPFFSAEGTGLGSIQFQFRAAATSADLASQPYLGPDGTSATSFTGDFQGALSGALRGKRYYQYKATLPSNTSLTNVSLVGLASISGPFTRDDVIAAMRIAGGLATAQTPDMSRLDVVKGTSSEKVDMLDVATIVRSVGGL